MLRPIATLVLSAVLLTAQSLPMQFNRMPRMPGSLQPANFQAGVPGAVRSPDDAAFTATLTGNGAYCVEIPKLDGDPSSFFMLHIKCIDSWSGECILDTSGAFENAFVPVGSTQSVHPYYDHVYVVYGLDLCLIEGEKAKISITLGGGW